MADVRQRLSGGRIPHPLQFEFCVDLRAKMDYITDMTLKMIEKAVRSLKPEEQRKFLRDLPSLIHLSKEDLARLNAAEKSFAYWNNPQDAIYGPL